MPNQIASLLIRLYSLRYIPFSYSKFLIILNDEDLKNNLIQVKNNQTKEEEKVELDYLMYYLDENIKDDIHSIKRMKRYMITLSSIFQWKEQSYMKELKKE